MDIRSLITVVVLAAVISLVIKQQLKTQTVVSPRYWIAPVIIGVVSCSHLSTVMANSAGDLLALLAAISFGGIVGIIRGSIDKIELNTTKKRSLKVYGSTPGLVLWLAFLAISLGIRFLLSGTGSDGVELSTIMPLFMTTGLLTGWRACWQYRYWQLSRVVPAV